MTAKNISTPHTIESFIKDFNADFGEYLWPLPDPEQMLDPDSQAIDFINLYRPKNKYSDWDIHCYLKPQFREESIIRKFEQYIFSYPGLINQGIFISKSPLLVTKWQHINNMNALQIMAFAEKETYAPFFDITLFGVENELIKKMYFGISGDDCLFWSFFTAWRKLKNIDAPGYLSISASYVAPLLNPGKESELFLNDPNKFFLGLKTSNYKSVVKFLTE